tara:strand:- start:703 stop:1542 length:840 start_codon:yes stop_codon:yes gene_type:complete
MCRWLIYIGEKISIKNILWLPENSLMKQSYKKPYTPFLSKCNWRDHEMNVDGFGISWYSDNNKIYNYKNIVPPWNDNNLKNLSEYINSKFFFSHIRAIKPFSSKSIVHEFNCHPFMYKNYLWMHNGDIKNISNLQKYVYSNCEKDILENIKGNTDSELTFYIFLNSLNNEINEKKYLPYRKYTEKIKWAIRKIIELNNEEVCSLNFAFTDGKTIICTRFINTKDEQPPSLYYRIEKKNDKKNIIISSEPINYNKEEWRLLPRNRILVFTQKKTIKFIRI